MPTTPPALQAESQKLSYGRLVTLFDLDTSNRGGSVYRFCPIKESNGATIVWQGNLYTPLPIEADGFEASSKGSLPQPTLTMSNIAWTATAILTAVGGDILGATLTRWKTEETFLDGNENADPLVHYAKEVWRVEQKQKETAEEVIFKLSAQIDQEGAKLPKRQITRDYCSHTYRVYVAATDSFDYSNATCRWAGSDDAQGGTEGPFFDEQNRSVDLASQDRCRKNRTACELRFKTGISPSQSLPARFFPGAGRIRRQ